MHFLKCNNCGFLNEVKTEYLVFCQKCNKKLANNFREWQVRNPEKTLDDFKALICVSDAEVNSNPVVKKSRPRSLRYWIGFGITLTIATIIGQLFGDKLVELIKFGKTSKNVMEQEWISEKYGRDGLTVETPYKLNPFQLPMPENVEALIDNCSSYMYETKNGLMIMINSVRYKPQVGTFDLQGAANGTVAEMKMQPGVSDFEYTEDYAYKEEIPGFFQKGTFIQGKVKMGFINSGFSKGLVFYQITVGYRDDDKIARQIAERVIASIKIVQNPTAI